VLTAGEVIGGRFEILALADWGGMGAVYRSRDRVTGREAALKLLLDTTSEERFAREARVLAELRHPAIVEYLAHGRTERGVSFLAMEWLEGHDLRAHLTAPLPVGDAFAVVRGSAEALAVAHARSIVHRDVNPRNLFLVGGDVHQIKVLDFGIARPLRATFGMTQPGVYMGTPGYMAPEQARGNEDVDARADVFALGCVLYECLTGHPAFKADNLLALLGKVLFEDAPRLRQRGQFPAQLDELVERMLSKDPTRRPADGAAVVRRLAELQELAIPRDEEPAPMSVSPRSLTETEQRLVCVVMAAAAPDAPPIARDGGTLASAGAESTREASTLTRFGARIERLADGSLVATLVGEGDATDHAANAARFALALREQLPRTPIVLATGTGVVTGRVPVGEVLDRASRLLGAPAAAETEEPERVTRPVMLDEVTAGLLDLRFDVVASGAQAELRGARESSDVARSVLGRPTSCVGRDRDLRTLEATFDECTGDGVARAVLVTAPAGLGKTRLRREFLRRVRRRTEVVEVFVGRGDPMSAGAPFTMIAQTILAATGIAEGEPLPARRHKLAARVERFVPEPDRARVAEFLGEIIGAPFPEEESLQLRAARQDPVLRGDQMRRAYEDWLRAECASRPVVLVLEDMHWGDLPSVKIVDGLLRNLRESPLMVLVSARPEVHDLFPGAWTHRGIVELRLSELTPKASERLVREVLGDAVSEDAVRRIVAAAEGNPFCLEELVRAEAEGKRDETPGSVLAVVTARIERLDPRARRVLRAASVFGQLFWRGAVSSLLGGQASAESSRWLEYLVEQEVVTKRGRGKFPGEDEYSFRHALVREAAYAMLVGEDRVLGHRLAAAWLEEAGERDALTLAEHFDRGQAADRAAVWYQRAAEQALEGNDLEGAVRRSERAITLGAEGKALAGLLQIQAEALKWRGANAESREAARRAMAVVAQGSDEWCAAAGEVVAASGKLGDKDTLVEIAEALLALPAAGARATSVVATARAATQLALMGQAAVVEKLLARLSTGGAAADPAIAGWVLEARAVSAGSGGDPGARVRLADAAAESFETAGDLRNACLQRVSVGYAFNEIGAYADAERALRGALSVAERLGLDNAVGTARAQLGRTLWRRGSLVEARAELVKAVEVLRAQKNMRLAAVATRYLAGVLVEQGELEGAEREARAAVEALSSVNAMLGDALAMLSDVQRRRGQQAEALETARRAMGCLEAAGKTAIGEAAIRLAFAEALEASGDRAAAREAIASATERLQARARTLGDAELRQGFLGDVVEHVRTQQLAQSWGG
jgi:tRNA A-37 threonylcarbamoyl transferase component Bud32/tetratricopeptide (TPR) repeat protein